MKHWEAISEAINTLRKRKTRLDLDNIFALLSRKNFKLTEPALEEVMSELEKKKKLCVRRSSRGWLVACRLLFVYIVGD